MGKETALLKAVKEKDVSKVKKLLKTSERKSSRSECLSWQSVNQENKIRVELKHININVKEDSTGCTPLLLAALYGSKEIVELLIFHSADIKARDSKGNTALHLAAFCGSLDMVELFLSNNTEVNVQNEDGNTALHITCQSAMEQRVNIIRRLITAGLNVWTKNRHGLTALDVSAQYQRNDAIGVLLECVPALKDNCTAIIEASIRGFDSTVELLLEYGVQCNSIDEYYGSSALHEAVRYNRVAVVKVLLAFQADPSLPNLKKETPRTIAAQLPPHSTQSMNNLLKEQVQKTPRKPQRIKYSEIPLSPQNGSSLPTVYKSYPELHNDVTWTQNHPHFCSSCTEKNPNTHILDDNLKTFWVIPTVHHAWTILDLQVKHVITGITVYGWNSPQMLKTFQLQTSDSIDGPWTTASSHTCQLLGSLDPKEPAFPQKFTGFTFCSRYIRLYLVDNHNGSCICFQGIRLHGADCRVIDTLKECGLHKNIDSFLLQGVNTWKNFLNISQTMMDSLVTNDEHKANLWKAIQAGRRIMYQIQTLTWLKPPVMSALAGEILPDFSVQSDPGVTEVVQLIVQGAELSGRIFQQLSPLGEKNPSVAVFSDIAITSAGIYSLVVKGVTTNKTLVSPKSIEIRPKVKGETEIESAFDEIQQMLTEVQTALATISEK